MSTRPGLTPPNERPQGGEADFPPGNTGMEGLELEAPFATSREEVLFERFVADMASRFAGIDPHRVDDVIVDSLNRIVDTLGLDRAVVWRRTRGEMNVVHTHCWVRVSTPSPPDQLRASDFPWVFATLDEGHSLSFCNRGEIPSRPDSASFERCGLQSAAIFPLPSSHENEGQYALAVSSITEPREWSQGILERLRLAAAIIGQALANREAQGALREAL